MLKTWFCVKKKQRPRGGTLRKTKSRHIMPMDVDSQVLVQGLFQPLKTRSQVFSCGGGKGATSMDDVYSFKKKIGTGGFSEVWLARCVKKPREDPVAVKLMARQKVSNSSVATEIACLKAAHNRPFIVQMTSNFQTPTHYGIVMKYATGGTLLERVHMVRRFSELVARFYGAEIAEGLFNLHNRGIIHRDLTLDNVLIGDNGHVLLSDFGLSLIRDPDENNDTCEAWLDADKAQFPAPELLLGQTYDKTVDWWSCGILMYRMVTGEYPFTRPQLKKEEESSKSYCLELIYQKEVYPNYLSAAAQTLISAMLTRRRSHRLGRGNFEESDVTNMDFFYNVDWCQMRDHVLPAPFHHLVPYGQNKPQKRHGSIQLPTSHLSVSAHLGATKTASSSHHHQPS